MSTRQLRRSSLIDFISFKGNDVTFESFPERAFIFQAFACCMTPLTNFILSSRHLSSSAVNPSITSGRIAGVSNVSDPRRASK